MEFKRLNFMLFNQANQANVWEDRRWILSVCGSAQIVCVLPETSRAQTFIKNLFARKSLVKEAVKSVSFDIGPGECVGFRAQWGGQDHNAQNVIGHSISHERGSRCTRTCAMGAKERVQTAVLHCDGPENQLWWDLPASESIYLNKCIYDVDDDLYRRSLAELSEMLDVQDLLDVQVRRLSLGSG